MRRITLNNEQIVLAERPEGLPGDSVFRYEDVETRKPGTDEMVIESVYISVDPYMRGRMNDTKSYAKPFELDEPIESHIVGRVTESNNEDFAEGDVVTGVLPWKKFNTVSEDAVNKVPSTDVPLHLYLSTLGMPGQAAYGGLLNIGKPQEGESVVVSAASGAVGSVAGQIAKIKGAKPAALKRSITSLKRLVSMQVSTIRKMILPKNLLKLYLMASTSISKTSAALFPTKCSTI